jgi:hypothetical protein
MSRSVGIHGGHPRKQRLTTGTKGPWYGAPCLSANWPILTAARAPSPFPSTSTSDLLPPPPRPTKSPRPPTGGPSPTDRPCPGSPPRLKPGAGRDKTAGGHHPRPVAGCCLRRGATGTPIGPRGLSCRGHPAKGPCRQLPPGLRISQQRTASA